MSDQGNAIARRTTKPPPGKTAAPSATLPKQLELTVILDEPVEKDDKWELTSKGYSKTLTVADAEQIGKGEKLLRFKIKPTTSGYTLTHHRSDQSKRVIIRDEPAPPRITKDVKPLSSKD